MDSSNLNLGLVQKYYDVKLTKEEPVLFYTRSTGKRVIEKIAATKIHDAGELQGSPEYATLGKDCQIKMLSHLIKNLREESTSIDLEKLSPEDRTVIETAIHVANFAENKIKAKNESLDATGVKLEKRALAQELEQHVRRLQGDGLPPLSTSSVSDDPAKAALQYLGIDSAKTREPALRFVESPPHVEQVPFDESEGSSSEVELQSREKQLMMQTHLISVLKGETPMKPFDAWAPSEHLTIKTAQNIASLAIQHIQETHGANTPEAKQALQKLVSGLELHLKSFGDANDLSRARRFLDNASPIVLVAGKVLETAKRYIETDEKAKARIEKLQPGQVLKLSRRLMTKERIASSVYIYKDFAGAIKMEVKYHGSIPNKKGDSADNVKAKLGEGAFNVVKRTLIDEKSPGVSKKPILKDEAGIADQLNEENATTRYRNANVANVFLPKAIGSVRADKDVTSTVALKEVKGTLYPFADGGSLSSHLVAGVLTETQAKGFIKNILEGLEDVHTKTRMAHRDLKPDNILIMGGIAYLADHGTSVDPSNKEFNKKLPVNNPLESKNAVYAGTPPYIAPEVVQSSDVGSVQPGQTIVEIKECIDKNQQADIWAMGLILFQIMNTPTTTHQFQGGPSQLVKDCQKAPVPAQAVFTANYNPAKYAQDFEQFKQNCKGRYSDEQINLVLGCLQLEGRPTASQLKDAFKNFLS